MALFNNYPQMTPQQASAESTQSSYQTAHQPQQPTIPENQPMAPVQQNHGVPAPMSSGTNPFMTNAPAANSIASPNAMTTSDPFAARSRESMNLGMDLAWTNGRHSPDAFASLSARHG
ncbi:hypothetical protein HG531_008071 [Fusarium graminearum]|nr:hypothetical protein HG531_008071 [Fusarium graminearum]